jgi:hypothetical protein
MPAASYFLQGPSRNFEDRFQFPPAQSSGIVRRASLALSHLLALFRLKAGDEIGMQESVKQMLAGFTTY